jgi:hypothetical protein
LELCESVIAVGRRRRRKNLKKKKRVEKLSRGEEKLLDVV